MKSRITLLPKVFYLLLALILTIVLSISASGLDTSAREVSNIQNQVSDKKKQLDALSSELASLTTELQDITTKVGETQDSLTEAKASYQIQYEAMKKRIQYLYEDGNTAFLDIIFSAKSLNDFATKIVYVESLSDFEKTKMDEFVTLLEEIKTSETTLAAELETLSVLEESLDEKKASLYAELSSVTSEYDKYTAQLIAAQAAADAANRAPINVDNAANNLAQNPTHPSSPPPTPTPVPPVESTVDDILLLAALLQAEAGINYDGCLAVASVVMNRMRHPSYPDTLRGVIYQPNQFSPIWSGRVDTFLSQGPHPTCIAAATDALNGANNVGECLSFRAAWTGRQGINIGGNVFF